MNINEAKRVAWAHAGEWHQDMHVVQRGNKFYAASDRDLKRQFADLKPIFTVKAR